MAKTKAQQGAIAISMKKTVKKLKPLPKAKMGGKNCWPGYKAMGTKNLNGKIVNNCVKK